MAAFLIVAAYIVISICVAGEFDRIAVMKGQPEKKYFWWCVWCGIAGWLMVAALPEQGSKIAAVDTDELPDL